VFFRSFGVGLAGERSGCFSLSRFRISVVRAKQICGATETFFFPSPRHSAFGGSAIGVARGRDLKLQTKLTNRARGCARPLRVCVRAKPLRKSVELGNLCQIDGSALKREANTCCDDTSRDAHSLLKFVGRIQIVGHIQTHSLQIFYKSRGNK